jgi:hypothetical protein
MKDATQEGAGGRPEERPAVRTTIVGGRPPGSGKSIGDIPRGIEVLLKKAAVDAEFRTLLLERRTEAADQIGLALDPAEAHMLNHAPRAMLDAVIARTTVSPALRPAFLGRAAAVMVAALGVAATSCDRFAPSQGCRRDLVPEGSGEVVRPQRLEPTDGIRPSPADPKENAGPSGVQPPPPAPEPTKGIRPDLPPDSRPQEEQQRDGR